MSSSLNRQMDARRIKGLTLVELMVSMVLGLIVVGGVVSVLIANKQSYRTNEALSQVQESARTAFELIARDVRQAAATGCDNEKIANVLKPTASPAWWQTWFGLRGYESAQTDPAVGIGPWSTATNPDNRAAGTDSIQVQGLEGTGLSVEEHNPTSANLKINATTTSFVDDDILVVCDFDHATILQATDYSPTNVTVLHTIGMNTPGNCSKGLGHPTLCTTNGNTYKFGRNSQIARFAATDWYIGNADGGRRSLFRRRLGPGGLLVTEEIAAGVTDLQIRYRLENSDELVDASHASMTAASWPTVNAVEITLTVLSDEQNVSTETSVNSGRLQRSFGSLITLRNRVP